MGQVHRNRRRLLKRPAGNVALDAPGRNEVAVMLLPRQPSFVSQRPRRAVGLKRFRHRRGSTGVARMDVGGVLQGPRPGSGVTEEAIDVGMAAITFIEDVHDPPELGVDAVPAVGQAIVIGGMIELEVVVVEHHAAELVAIQGPQHEGSQAVAVFGSQGLHGSGLRSPLPGPAVNRLAFLVVYCPFLRLLDEHVPAGVEPERRGHAPLVGRLHDG